MTRRQPVPTDMEDDFGGDGVCYTLYIHLLLKATNKPRKYYTRTGAIDLEVGQVWFSPTVFSRYFGNGKSGISAKTVMRQVLKLSKTFQKIVLDVSQTGYVVTIVDYLSIVKMESEDVPPLSGTSPGQVGDKSPKTRVNNKSAKKESLGRRKATKPPIKDIDEFRTMLTPGVISQLGTEHPRLDLNVEIIRCWNWKKENGKSIKDANATFKNRLLKAEEFKSQDDLKDSSFRREIGGDPTLEYVKTLSSDIAERLKTSVKKKREKVGTKGISLETLKKWVYYFEHPEELEKIRQEQEKNNTPTVPLTPQQEEENKKKAKEIRDKMASKFGKVIK